MATQRQSKFQRPAKPSRAPLRLTQNDLSILDLFAEPDSFNYLTAEMISLLTGRYANTIQKRLRVLYENEVLERYWPQPFFQGLGGSPKAVYFITTRGARLLREYTNAQVKPLKGFDVHDYHPQIRHTLAVNWFRSLILSACQRQNIPIQYQFKDRNFQSRFTVHTDEADSFRALLAPDWFFALQYNGQLVNFFLEYQRPTRRTKESRRRHQIPKSVKRKLESYQYFHLGEGYENFPNDKYPEIENLKNFRVLIVTDAGDQEFENLIDLTRRIDKFKKGLRIFYFARQKELKTKAPHALLQAPVWHTPVKGDKARSLLE